MAHVYTREHACASVLCLLRYLGEHVFVSACVCLCMYMNVLCIWHIHVYTRVEKHMYVYSTCIDSLWVMCVQWMRVSTCAVCACVGDQCLLTVFQPEE